MNLFEGLRTALNAITANKTRAALTMLGIIIGVAAVISLSSVGQGVETMVNSEIQNLGSNLVGVIPNKPSGDTTQAYLTVGDAEALTDSFNAPALAAVAPEIRGNLPVSHGEESTSYSIVGTNEHQASVSSLELTMGGFLTGTDLDERSRVAVLGWDAYTGLFAEGEYPIGQSVSIDGTRFQIIGVLKAKGGFGPMGSADEIIYVPLTTAHARLFPERTLSGERPLTSIKTEVIDEDLTDAAIAQITTLLRERHDIDRGDEDDFQVVAQQDALEISSEITGVLTLFLGAIAGISLLVGGIGIMNIMLVTVTERTREIGIRKAVGATSQAILLQFLIEAVVLTLGGGLVGILLGIGGSNVLAQAMNLIPEVTTSMLVTAAGVACTVGLIFGVYPAMRAASLHPIEALRYE